MLVSQGSKLAVAEGLRAESQPFGTAIERPTILGCRFAPLSDREVFVVHDPVGSLPRRFCGSSGWLHW